MQLKKILIKYNFLWIFFLIGLLCVFIDYIIYFFLFGLTGMIILPKIGSAIISVSVNYLLNSKFNFNNKQKISIKFYFSYILLYAFLIALNTLTNLVFVEITNKITLSYWLTTFITAICNYFAVKTYFKKINKNKDKRLLFSQ
jgi:putative flippase GtrA